jgi:hypothetical protein
MAGRRRAGRCPTATWWRRRGAPISIASRRSGPRWSPARAPGRKVELDTHGRISEGGIRVRLADNRAQLDQTFEARQSRMADELARVAMERLFASAPDLGTLVHG